MKLTINSQDLGNIGTIDTYNCFTSSSAEDCLIDYYNQEHDTDYTYDNFEWDVDFSQVRDELASASKSWLVENVLGKIVKNIGEITGTFSPSYYNFQTDSWEAEWDIDEIELAKYIDNHKEDYGVWYRDSSWAEHTDWRDDDDPKKTTNTIIAMLGFWLKTEFSSDYYMDYMYERSFEIWDENLTMTPIEES